MSGLTLQAAVATRRDSVSGSGVSHWRLLLTKLTLT